MRTSRFMCALAVAGFALGWAGSADAQDTLRWSDVDCAQSRLSAPPGMQCKATQNYAGGDSSSGNAGGTFRRWLASGRLNGAGALYFLAEATSLGASMMETASLQKEIRSVMNDSNMIHEFSPMGNRGGADYMTFMTGAGNSCVGMRRYGPSQDAGYKWILYGVSCDPRGKTMTDAQIDGFLTAASYRGA